MIRPSVALARRALLNALRRPQFLAPLVLFPTLFLAVNVMRKLGGGVSVVNCEGGGAEVTIRMPLSAIALS